MARYPVWKKGDKVKLIDCTHPSSTSHLRDLVRSARQAIVVERRERAHRDSPPSYQVKVRETATDAWYDEYREWNYYVVNATDVVKWGS